MANKNQKGSKEPKKSTKKKGEDNRPHMVRARVPAMNGGAPGSAQNAAARG